MLNIDEPCVGGTLKAWRLRRGLSQLELALRSGSSARHVSFIETGRALPGEAVFDALAAALDLPPHEARILRHSLGLAGPSGRERSIPTREAHWALALLLSGQDPAAAVAFDRAWDVVMVNGAAARFLSRQFGLSVADIAALQPIDAGRLNLLRLIFSPEGLRPFISNWEDVARAVLSRVRQAILVGGGQEVVGLRLADVLELPGVSRLWSEIEVERSPPILVDAEVQVGSRQFSTTSTITTLGTAGDGLDGIRIETFHLQAGPTSV